MKWNHLVSNYLFFPNVYPQLIQLQSYRKARDTGLKGYNGLKICCINEIQIISSKMKTCLLKLWRNQTPSKVHSFAQLQCLINVHYSLPRLPLIGKSRYARMQEGRHVGGWNCRYINTIRYRAVTCKHLRR